MSKGGLITLTKAGLFCERGGFYIDPWQPVSRAVLTHAHSDHARRGSKHYLVTSEGEHLARIRLDPDVKIATLRYGKSTTINGVKLSFHPAGHILGSSQVRVEYKGEVWVISGDYKLTPDATCTPFEPVTCNNFITEATFALPIYRWTPTEQVFSDINAWWKRNKTKGKASVLFAYSLGKSQRILNGIDRSIGPIFTHGAVERLTQAYREAGVDLPLTIYAGAASRKDFAGSLIVAPPSSQGTTWLRRFGSHSTGFASGWMMVRGARRQRSIDRGFVLSDHADWPELDTAIKASGAENIFVTHGFVTELVRWLRHCGLNAKALKTQFVGDDSEMIDEESER